jgi:tetratricopeptide (TPR) repeat protein
MRDYAGAATYYQRAVDLLPPTKTLQSLAFFRFVNDQLSMSYGLVGDLARSRAVNEAAIAKDPDYPIYYYNLACADAEAGDAASAQKHLQQAFDRRTNTLRGERMPDPAQDDSLLKLKDNATFWAFVQSLPKNEP